ncbi:unnamed protein product [Clonostachys chloroleuca]|uniref:Telomere-associated protein 1 n=1 Tax=Clonostachys chloroleuca TaxID=1926264 RepID=A0AA35MD48_9HYPO|nr:unnamed protein product [Clonostachys chloroleuca]
MATIEPRLIHLLNESKTPQVGHTDLPPLSSLPFSSSTDLPLPPIDREAGHQPDRTALDQTAAPDGPAGLSLQPIGEEGIAQQRKHEIRHDGNYAGSTGVYPLRVLLGESDPSDTQPYHLNRILDDTAESLEDASNKKRNRGIAGKDEFLQLPQPMKKQKATPHAPVMPPIINGLHEPPPDAALFPPIASDEFTNNDATQLKLLQELNYSEERAGQLAANGGVGGAGGADKAANRARKRATKPRRKWTEEETNHLLLGVSRHGVGKWTSILEDPDFKFNERTAGDLKDRFRTCCPAELRNPGREAQQTQANAQNNGKKGLHLDNILREDQSSPGAGGMITPPAESDVPQKPKKSRAHRKRMEDLENLGIHAPFKKSLRRERRPFTEQDDREILDGLHQYGPAWTKIQRDVRFHLSGRYPTDLRDRVRNKYPAIYQRIEKGTFQVAKDACRGTDIMEPSVTMSINNSLQPSKASTLEPQVTQCTSREELARWPSQAVEAIDPSTSTTASFEFGDSVTPHLITGEMDISRLLLEEPRML